MKQNNNEWDKIYADAKNERTAQIISQIDRQDVVQASMKFERKFEEIHDTEKQASEKAHNEYLNRKHDAYMSAKQRYESLSWFKKLFTRRVTSDKVSGLGNLAYISFQKMTPEELDGLYGGKSR